MKYKFQVDKKNFETLIANDTTFHSETSIRINRKTFNLLVGDTGNGSLHSFFLDHRPYQIEIQKNEEGYPTGIYVNGEFHPASLLKIDKLFYYKEVPATAKKSGKVRSFIPGNIKKIYRRQNDTVQEGDIVLIHEAMKMENEIRSPKSGVIREMGVEEGENILANHVLFVVE